MTGMPDDFAARLRAAGNTLPPVSELYGPVLAQQDRSGVQRHTDLVYGNHERHRLDVFGPEHEAPEGGWPVVAFFHGGGFIRGNKEHRENLGYYLAQQGLVAVLANYRLAPESRWPSGPEDVVAVWRWARREIGGYGGDRNHIVLMGESAGAAHVAAATLRTEFQPADWAISGAVLLAGPYNVELEGRARAQFGVDTPDPRNEPYFGSNLGAWAQASTVSHITAKPFPLLISYAELDLVQMQVQAGELFARLVCHHGFDPDLQVWPRHNHFSQGYSFGTGDESVSGPAMAFIRSHHCYVQVPGKPKRDIGVNGV